ncbi:MAG TPA: TonB-dependent receptor, partial [Chitinophagaceae bacterium]|nr:TonB-dependent receptor [Chitinophagaceae bacterium]
CNWQALNKYILLLVLFAFSASFSYAHQPAVGDLTVNGDGSVKGTVSTSDGKPASDVTVSIPKIRKNVLTDDNGVFLFRHLAPGDYEIEISLVGYETTRQTVTVETGKAAVLSVQLKVSGRQLDEVTITTGYNKFNKKETDDIARLPLKNIENPQVYSVVGKELMQEQQVSDYNSIFKNVPGAGVAVVYNQGRSALLSRGFTTANLIRNSVSGFVYTNIDPANLERVEAIKGPSGTLFNSSMISFGGLFNRVTKKPFSVGRTEISCSGAGFNLNRLTLDINRPLNEEKTALLRVNGALHSEKSFQDAGFTRSFMVAPGFVYKVSDKLTLLLDIEASSFNATSPVRFAPSATGKVTNIKDLGMNYRLSFMNNTLDYVTKQLNVFGQINYQLSAQWKSQTNFTRTFSTTQGYVTQLIGKTDSTLQQSAQKENFPYNGTEIQQNFIGDFRIGGLRNRIVAGLDFYNQLSDRSTPTINMPVINFKHPGAAYNNFNADKVDSAAARATYSIYQTNQTTFGVYISDVVNITDQLNIMLSLRGDRFTDKGTFYPASDSSSGAYSQNALSPKLGIVYEVVKDRVSLFGNYMNGFSNTGGTDYSGVSFKPQQANQWEAGFKVDMFSHRISSTVSYYNIDVNNVTRDDPNHTGYSIQDGTQLSKGIEAEVIANPFAGFNIVAGYSYNDSKYTNANKSVQGLRPASAGPARLANMWVSYRLMKGKLSGLGVGAGG